MKNKLTKTVEETISQFDMITDKAKPLIVAFSRGKDSTATIYILKSLEYHIIPTIVDRNDDLEFNGENIARTLKEKENLNAKVINLRDTKYQKKLCMNTQKSINKYLSKIDSLAKGESQCTPCYNARTVAMLDYATQISSERIVIGQHLNDMFTSLVKCYWTEKYFQEFTEKKGIAYNGYLMKDFIEKNSIDISYLTKMVREKRAATDDPPVEVLNNKIKLIRPLSRIKERDIIKFTKHYPHQSTNCSYRETEPRPFRLLVQWDLDYRIRNDPKIENILYELTLEGLNNDGTLKFRPRNKRDEYYPGFKPFIKKK